jgi:inhibitor of cysteine peptidase
MKSKLILVGTVAAISLYLSACSPAPKQVSVEVSCDAFIELQPGERNISKEVNVDVGDSFTVTLCSNPTTGFLWSETAQISDQTVLNQTDHKLVMPESEPLPPPGSPGKEVWTFQALKKGTSTIPMAYSRPWEGGEKAEWTFLLTVVVK